MGSIPEEALEPHGDRFVRDSVADGIPEWMRRGVHGLGHFAFVHREKTREMNVVSFATLRSRDQSFFKNVKLPDSE
jgi:hypothetical protein